MKLMHLADLHIGKRVNEIDMLPDQKAILGQIVALAKEERPDCVLIAGDVYDKTVPSAAAVTVLDAFLTELAGLAVPVFLVAGNHDSPERLQFGSQLLAARGIHIAGTYAGEVSHVTLADEHGPVQIHLLPFVKPTVVRAVLRDAAVADEATDDGAESEEASTEEIATYEDAVRAALVRTEIDPAARNVLVAHQFVTAIGADPEVSDSEVNAIGGLDQVDYRVFDGFDYVALGHLHGPQRVGRETVRYAGSPLKYSFSEVRQNKGVTFVELGAKGSEPRIYRRELMPLRDMRIIRGPLEELCSPEVAALANREDYLRVVLTDEKEILDAIGRVRQVYPNVMELAFERADREEAAARAEEAFQAQLKSPAELFETFFARQNGRDLEDGQRALLTDIWERLGGER